MGIFWILLLVGDESKVGYMYEEGEGDNDDLIYDEGDDFREEEDEG